MEGVQKVERGRRLVTVKELPNIPGYSCFSEAALRHLIFNSEDRLTASGEIIPGNGLACAVLRLGRRVLLDLDEFDRWIDTHRQALSGD